MKYFKSLLLIAILASCSSEVEPVQEEVVQEEPTLCDCNELGFDRDYNNFFFIEPRKGYTGTCETYFANGQVQMRKHFVKGKVHGKLTTYYEDGQLADEKEYDTNLQIGEQKSYTKDGVLKYHALYERGKQIKILVYPGDVQ
jgi:hypothetical protein